MTQLSGPLATETPPGSARPWRLTDAVIQRFVEDAAGIEVTWNFDPARVVGRVTSATRDANGEPWVTIDLNDQAPPLLGSEAPEGVAIGPQFVVLVAERDDEGEQPLDVHDARLLGVGLVEQPDHRPELQRCRACGCVDEMACAATVLAGMMSTKITCAWVETNLCSACAGLEGVKPPPSGERREGWPPEFPLTDAVRAQLALLNIDERELSGAPVWKHPPRDLTDAYAMGWQARDALGR